MKTNFSFTSKMHLFIIVTSILVAIGIAVGIICQFLANGFFNFGGDYSSYKEVKVTYFDKELSYDKVESVCENAFDAQGVKYYTVVTSGNSTESRIEYRFAENTDTNALKVAAESIKTELRNTWELAECSYSYTQSLLGGETDIMYAGIAVAAAVVFQFLYFVIRYKLTMAFSALLANVHNLAIYYALLAITRVQVSFWVIAMSAFVVVLTMICCGVFFSNMRRNLKDQVFKANSAFEQTDITARASFKPIIFLCASLAAMIALILVFTATGALSVYGLFMPCIAAILALISCAYGCTLFVPSVYSRMKRHADNFAAKRASKYTGAKKSLKASD